MKVVKFIEVKISDRFVWDNFVFTKIIMSNDINAISNKKEGYFFEPDDEVILC